MSLRRTPAANAVLFVAACLVLAAAVGCGGARVDASPSTSTTPPQTGYSGAALSGKAQVGRQPLIGAAIQLYAAGSTGNGSSSAALLTPALTTDATGAFNLPAGYICPASTSEAYLVARGGKPGSAASSENPAIALLVALGPCNQLAASSGVVVNEVTTSAAAYALSQFLSPGANIGASSTNVVGLQNAFLTASALAGVSSGASPGSTYASNASPSSATINTVANVLNACAASSAACATLFSATAPASAAAPANTLDAALNLVRNPASNAAALFALASAAPAFTPALTSAPADFTLYIDYSGGGLSQPSGLGIDSVGNVWVASYGNAASLFSPLGKPLFAQGIAGFGLSASYGLAVDASNNAWIPNEPGTALTGNSVSVLTPAGQSIAGPGGFTAGGLNYPIAVAIDTDASAWVVDYGNSHLTHLSSTGQPLSGVAGFSSPQIAFPVAAALDSSHNVWIANQSSGTVTRVSPDGAQFTSFACCNAPSNLAIDRLGNVWVPNFYGDSISEISASGLILSNGYTGGGLNHPQGIAIDGAGNVWIANYRGSSISELAGASTTSVSPGAPLSPAAGLGSHPALRQAYAIAVDASGNLWITNLGSNTVTEFIGLAVPVRTPLLGPPVTP